MNPARNGYSPGRLCWKPHPRPRSARSSPRASEDPAAFLAATALNEPGRPPPVRSCP